MYYLCKRQTTAHHTSWKTNNSPGNHKTIPERGISDKRSDYVLRETATHTPYHLQPQTAARRTPGRQHATPSLWTKLWKNYNITYYILHITCNINPKTYMMHIDTRRRQNRIKKARAANRRMSVNLYVAFLCRQHASYQQIWLPLWLETYSSNKRITKN